MSTLKFEELNLSDDVLNGINQAELHEATPLQQTIISNVTNQKDLLVKGESGDDKNTAIAITALETLKRAENQDATCVLVLTANAETARQICAGITKLSDSEDAVICVDDDGDREEQAEAIAAQAPIVVANPDRLQDLLQEHRFIFRTLDLLVLDEMHQLVNNVSDDHMKQIRRRILSEYTCLICSEQLSGKIKNTSNSFADKPVIIGFGNDKETGTPPTIRGDLTQEYINVPNRMKISTLMAHIEQTPNDNCVIFTASKRGTDRLYRVLKKRNLKATSLHRKLSDEKRAQRFANFTNSDVQFLLVADFSAAELDLDGVVQVINYDVPNDSDEYRFRAALVGNGKNNRIVSLVSKQDKSDISQLENELGQTPDEIPLPDKVKQKLKQRKSNSNNGNNKKKKSRNNGRSNRGRRDRQKAKDNEMQLPQPNYDKLSGGRSGNYDEKETGIVKFFKKLFS